MKIVLLEKVRNLGSPGDVITVKNGYARNFLIPRGKAKFADKETLTWLITKKKELALLDENTRKKAIKLEKRLGSMELNMSFACSEEGRLYGSVTKKHIHNALLRKGIKVNKENILLENPIKNIGKYEIEIYLYENIKTKIKINVSI